MSLEGHLWGNTSSAEYRELESPSKSHYISLSQQPNNSPHLATNIKKYSLECSQILALLLWLPVLAPDVSSSAIKYLNGVCHTAILSDFLLGPLRMKAQKCSLGQETDFLSDSKKRPWRKPEVMSVRPYKAFWGSFKASSMAACGPGPDKTRITIVPYSGIYNDHVVWCKA